jgi:hypothetical protein
MSGSNFTIAGAAYVSGFLNVTGSSNNISILASGDIVGFSDRRFKDDLRIIPGALDKLTLLNGYTYVRNDIEDVSSRFAGVVAQEVEQVLPEVVYTDDRGYKSVAYPNMVALTIEAIKEIRVELETIKEQIKLKADK